MLTTSTTVRRWLKPPICCRMELHRTCAASASPSIRQRSSDGHSTLGIRLLAATCQVLPRGQPFAAAKRTRHPMRSLRSFRRSSNGPSSQTLSKKSRDLDRFGVEGHVRHLWCWIATATCPLDTTRSPNTYFANRNWLLQTKPNLPRRLGQKGGGRGSSRHRTRQGTANLPLLWVWRAAKVWSWSNNRGIYSWESGGGS